MKKKSTRENLHKLKVLMWKNFQIQIRRPVQSFFEVLLPIAMCFILVYMRRLVDVKSSNGVIHPALNIEYASKDALTEVCYSPENPEIAKLMEAFKKKKESITITAFKNNDEMVMHLLRSKEKYKCGISFEDKLLGNKKLPKELHIYFRTTSGMTNRLFADWSNAGPRNISEGLDYTTGFLSVQHMLSEAIIEYARIENGKESIALPTVFIQRFPHDKFVFDPYMHNVKNVLAFIFLMGFIFPVFNLTEIVAEEKEKQLKILMEIMGSSKTMNWMSWFFKSLIVFCIIAIVMLLICKLNIWYQDNPAVFANSDVSVMFVFLLLYICATISFCFLVSIIFPTAIMASTVMIIMFLFTFQPYLITQHLAGRINYISQFLILLLSNSAFGYGIEAIASYEAIGVGIQWKNICFKATPENNIIMVEVMLMLLIDAVLYMLLTLYIEAIFPGKNSIAKKWNFIFKRGQKSNENNIKNHSNSFEPNEENKLGIEIIKIYKIFRNKYVALNEFSMKVYYGEVTLLLGPNGSGKTTILSIICGITKQTSGQVIINGVNINTQGKLTRSTIGLCLQETIFWNELTISQHLYFFSRLKGYNKTNAINEVDDYLYILNLKNIEKQFIQKSTPESKRLLSVGVAFCGNPDIVVLDEPTTEIDSDARRTVWEFIKSERKDRIVLITSHSMVEADVLADRVAIISDGSVKSYGTINFLKDKYGFGYTIIIEKSLNCKVDQIYKLLSEHIADVTLLSNIGNHLIFSLSKNEAWHFEKAFKDLERNNDYLGIEGFSISFTTLEEVFIK